MAALSVYDKAAALAEDRAFLAKLMGVDLEHFQPQPRGVEGPWGPRALSRSAEIVNYFTSNVLPQDPARQALAERARRAYALAQWRQRFDEHSAIFLEQPKAHRRVYSPLDDAEALVVGEYQLHRFQICACLIKERLIFLVIGGRYPYGIYYPAENLFLRLVVYTEQDVNILNELLSRIIQQPMRYAGWIRLGLAGRLRRAFVIGDNRPGHYIRENIAYLDFHQDTRLKAFTAHGGMNVILRDWCFLDPLALFPMLRDSDHAVIQSTAFEPLLLDWGLDSHRVCRIPSHPNGAWLRHRLGLALTPAGQRSTYRVLISIDAEKQRFLNQIDAVRKLLTLLWEHCRQRGTQVLEVVWDGWTVAGVPSERDLKVMADIRILIAQILDGLDIPLAQVSIFGRNACDKIPETATCDLAFVTRGTGTVIPCWLLQRPTISFHVPELAGDRTCLDDEFAFDVDPSAVETVPDDDAPAAHMKRFSLAMWGVEEAVRRALAAQASHCPDPIEA